MSGETIIRKRCAYNASLDVEEESDNVFCGELSGHFGEKREGRGMQRYPTPLTFHGMMLCRFFFPLSRGKKTTDAR